VAGPKGLGGVYATDGDFLSRAGHSPLLYTPDVVRLSNGAVGVRCQRHPFVLFFSRRFHCGLWSFDDVLGYEAEKMTPRPHEVSS